jgi:hypothetical protein
MRSRTTKPPPQIKMSPTPARIFIVIFFSVRRDRDAFYQSKADTTPPCSHGPVTDSEWETEGVLRRYQGELEYMILSGKLMIPAASFPLFPILALRLI